MRRVAPIPGSALARALTSKEPSVVVRKKRQDPSDGTRIEMKHARALRQDPDRKLHFKNLM